jgi:hypothetical protein
LVEQWSPKPSVAGSNPATPAILFKISGLAEVVEAGRHAILRGWWAKAYEGSNPSFGTSKLID